ncbi:MAG: secondary thiamine-phosphate synthase enzyme YjbQ [Spirochaetes bacterium]|nr:secondary thiamine-phosphate synthase enzyme YjbQ [Spirochaetota bacterium]
MMQEVSIRSRNREEFINIDSQIRDVISRSGKEEGVLTVFVPHTTAAVTINENADPMVVRDILYKLGDLIPKRDKYRHMEGNSDAHLKASLCGNSERILASGGRPVLGTWQSVYFCEFDGPRTRRVIMRMD